MLARQKLRNSQKDQNCSPTANTRAGKDDVRKERFGAEAGLFHHRSERAIGRETDNKQAGLVGMVGRLTRSRGYISIPSCLQLRRAGISLVRLRRTCASELGQLSDGGKQLLSSGSHSDITTGELGVWLGYLGAGRDWSGAYRYRGALSVKAAYYRCGRGLRSKHCSEDAELRNSAPRWTSLW